MLKIYKLWFFPSIITCIVCFILFLLYGPYLKFDFDFLLGNKYVHKNFVVYYPKNSVIEETVKQWTESRYSTFQILQQELNIFWNPEKKIKFFVFNSIEQGKEYGFTLGFANPQKGLIFTVYNQTEGHELMHMLQYSMKNGYRIKSVLINEGFATLYDNSGRDFDAIALKELRKNDFKISIFGDDFSKNGSAYSIGASFVSFLIKKYGLDNFKDFFGQEKYTEDISFYFFYGKENYELYNEWIEYIKEEKKEK